MNIEECKNIKIVDYLAAIGISPVLKRGSKFWYLAPYRSETSPSMKVNTDINRWYDFGTNQKGDLIELCKLLYRTNSIPDVLEKIARQAEVSHIAYDRSPVKSHTTVSEMTDIVVKGLTHPALLSYLRSRGIDGDVAVAYCKEAHYVVRRKTYFAIAFENVKGGYELRNSYFKGCIYGKHITHYVENGEERHVCVFEGFMDFLSYRMLERKGDMDVCVACATAYVILNSVTNRDKAVALLERYEHIHCYLDNDLAGRLTTEALVKQFGERATDEATRYEEYKDLNDYLRGKRM